MSYNRDRDMGCVWGKSPCKSLCAKFGLHLAVPKPWSLDWNQADSKQHLKSLLKMQIAEAPLWKFYFKRNLLEKEVP